MAYILLSGKKPFTGKTKEELTRKIVYSKIDLKQDIIKDASVEAKDFIKRCCTSSVKNRPSAATLLEHPWITNTSA